MADGREKHPICDKCLELKLPTTYMCGMNCPANPGAWELHGVFHKKLRKQRKRQEDGGAVQQRDREAAEEQARTPRRRATRTMSCWLRACGTPLRRTGAKQARPSARPSP